MPVELIDALIRQGATDLTVVSNNAGNGDTGVAALLAAGRVRKMVCSFPRQSDSWVFDRLYRAGRIELELVPQGNLAERMRAAGAGIGAFFCPTGAGTPLAEGKETREIDGRVQVLEYPIRGDLALVKAHTADRIVAAGQEKAQGKSSGAKRVWVIMTLFDKQGAPKLVPECTYPLTGLGCVDRVYTDLGTFDVGVDGLRVRELFGIFPAEVAARLAPIETPAS